MLIYYYDKQTGIYMTSVELPIQPYAKHDWTTKNPESVEKPANYIEGKFVLCFNETEQKWSWLSNYVLVYNINTKQSKIVSIGYILLSDETYKEPPKESYYKFVNGSWIIDTTLELEYYKVIQTNLINTSYTNELNGKFESDALGSSYYYASEQEDQQNLIGAVTTGQSIPFKVFLNKDDNVGQFELHTHSQLLKALNDGAIIKLTLMQKRDTLLESIKQAETIDEIISFIW